MIALRGSWRLLAKRVCRNSALRTFSKQHGTPPEQDMTRVPMEKPLPSSSGVVVFPLSASSKLKLQKGDITVWSVDGSTDAIVNAANKRMLGGGGVDGAIHRAAGPELLGACQKVQEIKPGVRCPTGEARITQAFRLPVSHVIHTVGPIYDSDKHPEASLRNAYRNSLILAKENNIQYIAFPAISCGAFGYPYKEASKIAISTVMELSNNLSEVHFVLYSDELYDIWVDTARELLQGVDKTKANTTP